MASITAVNVGSTDDDGTGDTLRAGGTQLNANIAAVNSEVEAATSAIAALGALAALDTVDTGQIDDDAVTNAKIAGGAVNADSLATGAVQTLKIADEAVTTAKFQHIATASILGRNTGGTGDVEVLNVATVQALLSIDHLITLSGVAEGQDDLSTFSGSIIPDGSTNKEALQALETAVEANTAEFSRTVTATGGTTTLAEATHRNALIVLTSGTNTVAAPSSDTGTWVATCYNDTATNQTVVGQTVAPGGLTTILIQGTTATPFSTSEVKVLSIYIGPGDDAVLWQGAPLFEYPAYTVIDVQHQTTSGTITLNFELEDSADANTFTSITSLSAVAVSSTKSTATASAANVSDDGERQLRITGSSNSSSAGLFVTMRVRV